MVRGLAGWLTGLSPQGVKVIDLGSLHLLLVLLREVQQVGDDLGGGGGGGG